MKSNPVLPIIFTIIGLIIVGGLSYAYFTSLDSNKSTPAQNTNSSTSTPSAINPINTTTSNTKSSEASSNASSSSTSSPITEKSCIVTISGQKYNVQELIKSHPGGDVFECGKDNTSIFFSNHNKQFLQQRVAKYKVS